MVTNNHIVHCILKLNILKHFPVLKETYLLINTFYMEIILILLHVVSLKPGEVLLQVHTLHSTWPIREGVVCKKEWLKYFLSNTKSRKYKNKNVS